MSNVAPLGGIIDRNLNYGRHLIDRFFHDTSFDAASTLLDLGAGAGDDLLLARKNLPDAKLHAIEVYPPYQDLLRGKGIVVHSINIERDRFPFENVTVDIIIANQILEHVKEVFWIFHEISRTLRTGGTLIIGVPNLASLHNRLLLALGRQPTSIQNNSAHVRGYTKRDLLKLLESCFPGGYSLEQFGGGNFYPFPPFIAKPLAAILPNMAWGIFFKLKKLRSYRDEFLTFPIENRLETNFFVGR